MAKFLKYSFIIFLKWWSQSGWRKFLIAAVVLLVLSRIGIVKGVPGKEQLRLKEQLASRSYSVIILERRNYMPVLSAKIDGIVFMPSDYRYHYIRRLDDDHLLRLNSVSGEQAPLAKPEDSFKYLSLIQENKLYPDVIRDKNSKELFMIYTPVRERVVWSQDKQGQILLEVRDPFKRQDTDLSLSNPLFRGTK